MEHIDYLLQNKDFHSLFLNFVLENNSVPHSSINFTKDFIESYLKETLLNLYISASPIVVYFAPVIFGVNIEVRGIDYELTSDQNRVFNTFSASFKCLNDTKIDKIYLIYSNHHYNLVYNEQHRGIAIDYSDIYSISPNVSIIPEFNRVSLYCKTCYNITQHIQLSKLDSNLFCIECTKSMISSKILTRSNELIHDSYALYNIEYYTRPIELNKVDKYYLWNIDLELLFGSSMKTLLRKSNFSQCFFCKNHELKKNTITLKCNQCTSCKTCIEKYIKAITDEKMVLNLHEFNNLNQSKIKSCSCKNIIDYSDYLTELYPETHQQFIDQSIQRMELYLKNNCFKCSKPLKASETTLSFKFDNLLNHYSCKKCYDDITLLVKENIKIKSQDKDKTEYEKYDHLLSNDKVITCSFCHSDHLLTEKDLLLISQGSCNIF